MNHRTRTLATAAAFAAGVALLPLGAHAAKVVELDLDTAPPPPPFALTETPPPRAGYIVEPGHYEWDGDRYVWHEHRYLREREGHRYLPPSIERREDRWHYRAGHWDDDD
ncbi:MAG: hypothetical protein U1F48_16010 [Burkholderiales bacterium]